MLDTILLVAIVLLLFGVDILLWILIGEAQRNGWFR